MNIFQKVVKNELNAPFLPCFDTQRSVFLFLLGSRKIKNCSFYLLKIISARVCIKIFFKKEKKSKLVLGDQQGLGEGVKLYFRRKKFSQGHSQQKIGKREKVSGMGHLMIFE